MDTPSDQSLLTDDPASANTAGTDGQGDAGKTVTPPTDAPKPGEGQGEGTKEGDDKGKPQGAPEKYEAFKMPEGFAVDEQLLGEFEPTLKELGLTQEAAQKVIDFAPKVIEKTVQQTTAKVLDQLGIADHAKWAEQSKNDKEFGGEKLAENLGVVRRALDTFGTPELRAALNKVGLGNHPEVLRFFYRAGKTISADSYVPGGKTTSVNPAARLYDKSNMNP